MGIKEYFKKQLKEVEKNFKEKSEYNAKLQKEVKDARRQAYLKESIKQAKLKAMRDAKQKFNPPKTKNNVVTSKGGPSLSIEKNKQKRKKEFEDLIWKY